MIFHVALFVVLQGCPHAAIREDCSANLAAVEELTVDFKAELAFVESGGGA